MARNIRRLARKNVELHELHLTAEQAKTDPLRTPVRLKRPDRMHNYIRPAPEGVLSLEGQCWSSVSFQWGRVRSEGMVIPSHTEFVYQSDGGEEFCKVKLLREDSTEIIRKAELDLDSMCGRITGEDPLFWKHRGCTSIESRSSSSQWRDLARWIVMRTSARAGPMLPCVSSESAMSHVSDADCGAGRGFALFFGDSDELDRTVVATQTYSSYDDFTTHLLSKKQEYIVGGQGINDRLNQNEGKTSNLDYSRGSHPQDGVPEPVLLYLRRRGVALLTAEEEQEAVSPRGSCTPGRPTSPTHASDFPWPLLHEREQEGGNGDAGRSELGFKWYHPASCVVLTSAADKFTSEQSHHHDLCLLQRGGSCILALEDGVKWVGPTGQMYTLSKGESVGMRQVVRFGHEVL